MSHRAVAILLLSAIALSGVGCSPEPQSNPYPSYGSGGSAYGTPNFKDDAESNATVDPDDLDLEFIDIKGNKVALKDFRDSKNAVLVFTRGISSTTGQVCPFCTAQTSRLAANYDEFARRNTEVLAVFPGDKARVDEFLKAVVSQTAGKVTPFPIVLDEQFAAVDQLGIRGDQAKPSTYILDKQGQVRFGYVGAHVGDRPSVKALLKQLDALEQEQGDSAPPAEAR